MTYSLRTVEFTYMRKLISLTFGLALAATFTGNVFAAYTYSTYNNGTFCTQDAYVCPNGTTVGRTGSNCQFVCPSTPVPVPVNNSYTYTSGCYTYYYNGSTLSTTIVSYNCSNNYNNNYTNYTYPTNYSNYYYTAPTSYYTQPTSYTYPYNYYQYQPTYSNYNYQGYYSYPSGYTDTGYNNYNYGNYYNTGYNQSTSCYYLAGIQVCY